VCFYYRNKGQWSCGGGAVKKFFNYLVFTNCRHIFAFMEPEIILPTKQTVLSIVDYAAFANVSRQTVYKWIKKGKIVPKQFGSQQFLEKKLPTT